MMSSISLQEHLRIISAASLACTSTCLLTLKLSVIPSSFMHPTFPSVMFKPLEDEMLKLDPLQVPFSDNGCRAVPYHGALAKDVLGLQLADQLGRVISSVLCDDGGQLSEKEGSQHDHACT